MQTNNTRALLSEVPDPTDFPTGDLRQLDASFRCTICSELYAAPVILDCAHCFCSFCIRQHIQRVQECPSCRKPAVEARLRLIPVLEEAVEAWKRSRPTILQLSRHEQPATCYDIHIPSLVHTNVRKRKRRTRSESSSSNGVRNPLSPDVVEGNDETYSAFEPTLDMDKEEIGSESLVHCPICGRQVEYQGINQHMDGPDCGKKISQPRACSSTSGAKNEWSRILGKNSLRKGKNKETSELDDTIRLPKVSYTVVKDKAIKELLASQNLPTTGDRNTWVTRHRRWVMMYNANLDKSEEYRKTLSDLRSELKRWEQTSRGSKFSVTDSATHGRVYRDEFNRLVQEARRSKLSKAVGSSPQKLQDNDGLGILDHSEA